MLHVDPIRLIREELAAIRSEGNYTRRIPEQADARYDVLIETLNGILGEVEQREKALREKVDELTDIRDDAQTANAMLKHVRNQLKARSKELDASLEQVKSASDAKSQFLANVSHEIRTPMNGILGMAEILMRMDLGARPEKMVRTILDSGRALLTIINDVLDFSKIESGVIEFDPKPFNVRMCIDDVAALLRAQAEKKNIGLEVDVAADLPDMLVGDAARLRQILINLVGNGLKFTDEGHVAIRVSCDTSDGVCLTRIEIQDTGVGIPEDKVDAVFEKFNQVDNTSTRKHEGTGLGLTIFSLLVDKMGGKRGLNSVWGEGSTFWFELPMEVHEQAADEARPAVSLMDRRLMLVEPVCVQSESAPLMPLLSGLECQTVLETRVPLNDDDMTPQLASADIVVLRAAWVDDGTARDIEALRANPSFKRAAIVVVTDQGNKGDARLVEDAGAQAYVPLPVEADLLEEVITTSLANVIFRQSGLVTRFTVEQSRDEANGQTPDSENAKAWPDSKILLVEDSLVNQMVAQEFLEELVGTVTIANNGEEAVALSAEDTFDIILMDCQMPVMDGFAATQAIRARELEQGAGQIPIVALTANAFASDKEKCIASGMSDFLSKPFMPDDFEEMIGKWMSAER